MEATARLDFLWRLQARKEVEDMKELREHNECLLLNILPAHVAQHFLERDRNDEVPATRHMCVCHCVYHGDDSVCVCVCVCSQELYSQSYERVGVLFASLPGFTAFYEQKELIHQPVECLRLLNNIITNFDEVTNTHTRATNDFGSQM